MIVWWWLIVAAAGGLILGFLGTLAWLIHAMHGEIE